MELKLDKVIGHRGACGYAPENTLASMVCAYQRAVKWVEFDVMLAGSGEPIIFHDDTLERTTNGKGRVLDVDYQTIALLDCGIWFSPEFKDLRVPSLGELLKLLSRLNLRINLEIKPYPGTEEQTVKKTLELLAAYWPAHNSPPLLSSFSVAAIKAIHQNHPGYALGYLIDSWEGDWERILDTYQCDALHVDHCLLSPERIERIKASGRYVLAYTVNEPWRAYQLISWGVDAVFSDYPDKILKFLNVKGS